MEIVHTSSLHNNGQSAVLPYKVELSSKLCMYTKIDSPNNRELILKTHCDVYHISGIAQV